VAADLAAGVAAGEEHPATATTATTAPAVSAAAVVRSLIKPIAPY
jgi:hypothetical protein